MEPFGEVAIDDGALPLAFLLGKWLGSGTVLFHSIEPTSFEEEIRFSHRGRSWLVYEQHSWRSDDSTPLHTEMGIWRMVGPNLVNSFVALTAGVDFGEGTVHGNTIALETTSSRLAEGVEPIMRLTRKYQVTGDTMDYEIDMGTDRQPLLRHVTATLGRVSSG